MSAETDLPAAVASEESAPHGGGDAVTTAVDTYDYPASTPRNPTITTPPPNDPVSPAAAAMAKPLAKDSTKGKSKPKGNGKAPKAAPTKATKTKPQPKDVPKAERSEAPAKPAKVKAKPSEPEPERPEGAIPIPGNPDAYKDRVLYDQKSAIKVAAAAYMINDGTRLRALDLLYGVEVSVKDIAAHMGASQPAVSHHLALLRHGGAIYPLRRGKNNFYTLTEFGRSLVRLAKVIYKAQQASGIHE